MSQAKSKFPVQNPMKCSLRKISAPFFFFNRAQIKNKTSAEAASNSGLPDGFFSGQFWYFWRTWESQFGYILEDLGMENVVIYSGH
jgi:hypothetical protein